MAKESTFPNSSGQPKSNRYREVLEEFLKPADIQLNGERKWDIRVNNDAFYSKILVGGSLAFGESYMDGWWDCEALDELFDRLQQAMLKNKMKRPNKSIRSVLRAKLSNLQSRSRAVDVGGTHYNNTGVVYQKMLDKRMVYSGAYWKSASDLDEAQEAKLDLICRKIMLKPGMRLLDIGCGAGSFPKYAVENYDVEVVGITVSEEQLKQGRELCEGLPVELRLQDYREIDEEFDRIVSVGMFEHVGAKNHKTFMKSVLRCLVPDGIFLLHTIGALTTNTVLDPWINKYIYPDSLIPSARHLTEAAEGLFIMEDWHNIGSDYDKTLMAWHAKFEKGWESLRPQFDERFHRMWRYYLLSCAGSFRARSTQLWQIVFSINGVRGGYESVR
ncbi:cyclopropane fatty acyl phospholipid synthase [Candidatus Marinimicrobia bacterium MT.SAG.2]|nr:cyclopropane fatty acyl phospholipid synthase [Candidatus Marinimicrobia bacterium MT.SAG.2]